MSVAFPTFCKKLMTIEVKKLRVRAYIGYIQWEKEKLQDLVISYRFKYDTHLATEQDKIEYGVNYKDLTKSIIALIDNKSFHLIETVAEVIFQTINNFHDSIQDVQVRVEKPNALRFSDNVLTELCSKDRKNICIISIGSNIHAEKNFKVVMNYLQTLGTIIDKTQVISTKPLKFTQQDDFLNGAVLLLTHYKQSVLQSELKQIESFMGRVRTQNKNAPRTIDLDIISFNNTIVDPLELEELPFLKDFITQLNP